MIEVKKLSKTYITKESKGFFRSKKKELKAVSDLSMVIKKR